MLLAQCKLSVLSVRRAKAEANYTHRILSICAGRSVWEIREETMQQIIRTPKIQAVSSQSRLPLVLVVSYRSTCLLNEWQYWKNLWTIIILLPCRDLKDAIKPSSFCLLLNAGMETHCSTLTISNHITSKKFNFEGSGPLRDFTGFRQLVWSVLEVTPWVWVN